MSRIPQITADIATTEQQALFDAVQAQLGIVPNFVRIFAHSPAALRAFLGLFSLSGAGSLPRATRERIALAIAQQNACEYCLSAHSALGSAAGLDAAEIAANRAGSSHDAKAAAAVQFARTVLEQRGELTDNELQALYQAGYSHADAVEIITHVSLNLLTNLLGKVSQVEIDFPRVAA